MTPSQISEASSNQLEKVVRQTTLIQNTQVKNIVGQNTLSSNSPKNEIATLNK